MRQYVYIFSQILLMLCFTSAVYAEQRRLALVIGNAEYAKVRHDNLFGPLENPEHDAQDVTEMLEGYGFKVLSGKNLNQEQMETLINDFVLRLQESRVGLLYFSGHGVQVDNFNYLIPSGRKWADAQDVKFHAINANLILEKMEAAGPRVNIMILDACRDAIPRSKQKGFSGIGLSQMGALGVIIGYATSPGSVAYGAGDTRNSVYTHHLLKTMQAGDIPIEMIFKKTRAQVVEATSYKQVPWTGSGLIGDFCFGTCAAGSTETERYILQWGQEALEEGKPEKARHYFEGLLKLNPKSSALPELERELRYRLPLSSAFQPDLSPPKLNKERHEPLSDVEFVWVDGGCFKMGCMADSESCPPDEIPAHKACVDAFWIGKFEVTQAQWQRVMQENPSEFQAAASHNLPVEQVSWNDIQQYLQTLNSMAGQEIYRLPSEAEWEYAARAGTSSPYHFSESPEDIEAYAWCQDNSKQQPHSVGQLKPNAWGLFDIYGNVKEWCGDRYSEQYYTQGNVNNPQGPDSGMFRVLRGGSWNSEAQDCRSSVRSKYLPLIDNDEHGFRLVAEPQKQQE